MFAAPECAGYGVAMRIAALLVLLVGCPSSGGDDYHVIPGGDDHPINPMPDAPPADGLVGDGAMLTGRVCVTTDLRTPTVGCATTGAANILVQLGTETPVAGVEPPDPRHGHSWRHRTRRPRRGP